MYIDASEGCKELLHGSCREHTVKTPHDIMVFVTKFLSLGDTPSFTPLRIPASHISLAFSWDLAYVTATSLCTCPGRKGLPVQHPAGHDRQNKDCIRTLLSC